jgi:putative ABC transport system substrate-binding protein
MQRRQFLGILGGAAVGWSLAAPAQQPAKPVIGFLGKTSPENAPAHFAGFRQGMKEVGFVEGQNTAIEYCSTKDRFPELAADLVRRRVDLIFAAENPASLAAKTATATIPIVFAIGGDPVKLGLVASFSHLIGA